MSPKVKVTLCVLAVLTSYAIGRWTSPTKVVTVTKTVTVETKQEQKDVDAKNHTKTVKTEKVNPDGSRTSVTVTTNDSDTKSTDKSSDNSKSDTQSSVTVERTKQHIVWSFMAGAPISLGGPVVPVYGGQVYKEALGPIGLGVWYLSNNTGGLSVGLSF